MLKESYKNMLFNKAIEVGDNYPECIDCLIENLLDYGNTEGWILTYSIEFSEKYFSKVDKNASEKYIKEKIEDFKINYYPDRFIKNEIDYGYEDKYIDNYIKNNYQLKEIIKKENENIKLDIDTSLIYKNICNHKSESTIDFIKSIGESVGINCDILDEFKED